MEEDDKTSAVPEVQTYFNSIAKNYDYWKVKNRNYYNRIKKILRYYVRSSSTVLDFGCGTGELLNHLDPKFGTGYDPSNEMLNIAKNKFQRFKWVSEPPSLEYDVVYSVDVIEYVKDLNLYIRELAELLKSDGILILIFANPIWEPILLFLERIGIKMPDGPHHRFSNKIIQRVILKNKLKIEKINYFLPKITKIGLIEVWEIKK